MGGTGNTGKEPQAQAGALDAAGGNPNTPGWVGPAQAPGTTPADPLASLTTSAPTLRPYEETTASAGTGAGPATGLLAPAPANPMGFQSASYPVAAKPVNTFAAAAPPAAAPEAPKEFAAPTSFRPIYDATSEVNTELSRGPSMKRAEALGGNWINDPELSREWLQAIADHGGDWRKTDQYYNPVTLAAGQKIYWPGDPARPK